MGRTRVVITPVMVRMVPRVPMNRLSMLPPLKNCRMGSMRVVRVKYTPCSSQKTSSA